MTEEKPWESSSLIERLKWWAFKFCGKGYHETMASDVMTEAHERIEKLEAALREIIQENALTEKTVFVGDFGKIARKALGEKDD
jgi:hypothetical protein